MTDSQGPDELEQAEEPPGRRRRGLRATLVLLASVIVLLGAAAVGAFIYVNHDVGSIPRVSVKHLAKANSSHGMTILLTSNQLGPTGLVDESQAPTGTGLIMLLHLNADRAAGGAASIPPQIEVYAPGAGQMQLFEVTAAGGPSLLTQTVHKLTGVPINHYVSIDFTHVASLVDALGGVSVTLPETTESLGYVFYKGVNHLNGIEALAYARQPSLTQTGRVLRQSSLMRAVLSKLADKHLLTNPWTMSRVLNALTSMLTVDSTFTNSQILSLATDLGGLSSSAATFVTAPTKEVHHVVVLNPFVARALWRAIRTDSLASFAQRYPDTVTPAAP